MKIVNRDLAEDKDGIPGYLAHPDRKEPGPGVLIVHHHYGVTGNMKVNVCNFAKLGYTTIVPDLYKMLGYCMGGRIGIHFVAATPSVRGFVGYYPSVRDEGPSKLRPRHPEDAVKD